ncbi:TerB family tellurite resistance protein [Pararhodobacter oceanensis]|uniref:TerB family tellurite resistance protein n=1 Tax=Pararhodobacter oceanensis TaxID=2172121 RepID=UPI003A91D658
MSLWLRITAVIEALRAGEPLSVALDHLRAAPERSIAFTIGVIALGAKLAKADGVVTRDEVAMFRSVFTISAADEKHAARIFNLARQDVAGFDAYARKIAGLFPAGDPVLRDLLEGLFHIAMADGTFHPNEEAFLRAVSQEFGLNERCFTSIMARVVPGLDPDPYDLLELPQDASLDEARAAYRRLARESHPDALRARGVPDEAVKMAEDRLKALNNAWSEVQERAAA